MLEMLADGWEPFAVTEQEDGASLWLRRPKGGDQVSE
jgi:hypothetical protein